MTGVEVRTISLSNERLNSLAKNNVSELIEASKTLGFSKLENDLELIYKVLLDISSMQQDMLDNNFIEPSGYGREDV